MRRRATIPARINIIGEHTDYAGGKALPFALDVHLVLEATALNAGFEGGATVIELWKAAGGWPARLSVESEIPIGVGMSSSAALCLAVVLCVHGPMKPLDACREAQRIEHEVLKTPCGLLDQMAMMHGKQGYASLIDFSRNSIEDFPVPNDWLFKLVDSGIHRTLGDTSYRDLRNEAAHSAHVESENQRVDFARNASPKRLGELLNQSHTSLQQCGLSVPEMDKQVGALQRTEGVLGARMMGGGFGGMILVLVASEKVLPNQRLYRPSQGGRVEELFE
ncbi:MAG: hypothetical protein L7U62_07405 [Candidatus Poseidoniaceae archaeon]|nr:hypothetical protein [Candidatus Poseidoniaceae archaeon]